MAGKKSKPGQTDHIAVPHIHTHDFRHYEPNKFDYDVYSHCKWPKDPKKLDTPEY